MNLRFLTVPLLLALALCGLRPAAGQNSPTARLDINRATVEEIAQLPGVGPTRAAALVRVRDRNGPFRQIEEIRAVPRLSERIFQTVRDFVTVTLPAVTPSGGGETNTARIPAAGR